MPEEQNWELMDAAAKARAFDYHIATLKDEFRDMCIKNPLPLGAVNPTGVVDSAALMQDANIPSAFTNKQLEFFSSEMFRSEELPTTWRQVFNVNSEMPETMDTFTQHYWTGSGVVKWFRAGGDVPKVEVGGVPVTIRADWLMNAYQVTEMEMATARAVGVPLDAERAIRAREAHEEKANTIVFIGDAETNREGLVNHPNITVADAPTGDWASTTTLLMLADLNFLASRPFVNTKTNAQRNGTKLILLISPIEWNIIMSTPMSVDNPMTVAQMFVNNSPWVDSLEDILAVNECEGTGTAGASVAIAVPKNRRYCEVIMPAEIRTGTQSTALKVTTVPVMSKFGALMIRYPLYLYQMEKIEDQTP